MATVMDAASRSSTASADRSQFLKDAVHQNRALSVEGANERLFTLAFRNLVYAQIWEDPAIDLEALELNSESRMVVIASGGCNMMSYLTAKPAHITAVDLNAAHVALNRLKLATAQHLGDHESFRRFFVSASDLANVWNYREKVRPHLDDETRDYWDGRDSAGRQRITRFSRNIYHYGLLGRFIKAVHVVCRMHGVDPRRLVEATSLAEQRAIYERDIKPLFDRKMVRWLVNRPATLFGLGIPPAQYKALAGDHADGLIAVLRHRVERLACDFEIRQNYFAWQAFARQYDPAPGGAVPPYLELQNFDTVRRHADRVAVRQISFTVHLAEQPSASLDRYVLLDAQDWMSDADLTELWNHITRTAKPGARVIFRTAAEPTLLPGRVPDKILRQWDYHADRSKEWTTRDRSAIYGGFHLYVKAAAAS